MSTANADSDAGSDPRSNPRSAELAANVADVNERIDRACNAAGRSRDELTLVAVTKTWPADDVVRLAILGVTDVGENRDQEAAPKHDDVALLDPSTQLRWHFIGQLQRNKARSVARYCDVVQSVDRESLIAALATAREPEVPLTVLLQVSLDGRTARGGALDDDIPSLADAVESTASLRLGGLMAVAPLDADPDEAFARLWRVSERLRIDHPLATAVSAGMSGDLEAAIRQGATHIRVGTSILGHRPAFG